MLEVKPTSPVLRSNIAMGHADGTRSNGFMVTGSRLDQVEVLNRLNGNYTDFHHLHGESETSRQGYRVSSNSICHNYRQNIPHDQISREGSSISAISSPSSATSSPSSSLSSLSSSSSSAASSSTLSSSEVDYDKENKNQKSNLRRRASPKSIHFPCSLEAAVRNTEASFYALAQNAEYATSRNRNSYSPISITHRHSSPCSEPTTPMFSRSPCREDNRGNRYTDAQDNGCRNSKRLINNYAWRSSSPCTRTGIKYNSNRPSPTRIKPCVGEVPAKCPNPGTDSGLISPTSRAIADSLAERRACHDFAKYLISPSSASPSSRSPSTPSSNHSGAASSSMYKGIPFSRSASALSTKFGSTPSPASSCSSSPTLVGRLRSPQGNSYHQHHIRRQQQRDRKFRLNLFMYSALYRKQRRTDTGYIIYHNPIEDPDATYTSFSNPNYFLNRALHHHDNNNDSAAVNGNTSDNSDYSSCGPTPTSPDRAMVLNKLNFVAGDSDNDDDDHDDFPNSEDGERYADANQDSDDDNCVDADHGAPLMKSRKAGDYSGEGGEDCGTESGSTSRNDKKHRDEPARVYFGVGSRSAKRSRGILGYLEMLEQQALGRAATNAEGNKGGGGRKDDRNEEGDDHGEPEVMQGGDQPVEEPPPQEKFELGTEINSPDSNDSGFQASGEKTPALTPQTPSIAQVPPAMEESQPPQEQEQKEVLPEGWQKHEDEDGPYYWHVKSGTIQRDPPPPAPPDGPALCSPRSVSLTSESSSSSVSSVGSVPSTPGSATSGSGTERHLAEFEGHALQYAAKSLQSLSSTRNDPRSTPSSEQAVRYAVRSLGWVQVPEEDLTPERSSKAVNRCIVDLSLGRNNTIDAVGRWGDGKDLYMDLDHSSLRLVDPVDNTILNSQPIHSIRVWGVGRDNGRDFAYVARDRGSRLHMCHVFQCEVPARQIASSLRDVCKRIMLERSLHQSAVARLSRPTDLPNLDKIGQPGRGNNGERVSLQSIYNNARFPTPMEEPRKVMRCHYLGVHEVMRPTGRDILNEAIQHLYYRVPPEKWKFVNVAIAPSTITITEHGNPDGMIEECRVRFLSFMGIAVDNVKLCAFIMHTSQNKFQCHVFHAEPSAGPICKTIEAACKLRYQKCLDAHPQTPKGSAQGKRVSEVVTAGVKAGVQGLKVGAAEIKSGAVQGVMSMYSLFKGRMGSINATWGSGATKSKDAENQSPLTQSEETNQEQEPS